MAVTDRQTRARMSRQESRSRIIEAATELVRRRSYAELSVDEVMSQAGLGRTIFYRHFDDLADLMLRASREAIDELYAAMRALGEARPSTNPAGIRSALQAAVDVYHRHGPVLRAVGEAAAGDPAIAQGHVAMRARFDEFVTEALAEVARPTRAALADLKETARALNLMNEQYLLDAFGREPRVPVATAVQTLTEIWTAVVHR
jgi:AcrR family transcriptional regulator